MIRIKILIGCISLFLMSCNTQNPNELKENLPGYWEIKEVKFPDGEKKEYEMNLIIDHIELDGEKGKRTKVSPELDGSFTTNGVSEDFVLKIENDSLYMVYTTPFDEWKEAVLDAQDNVLVIKNRDRKTYTYKKYSSINSLENQ